MISQSKRRGGCLIKLFLFLLPLILVTPFILTSSFVMGNIVLPQLEESTGSRIVADIDISLLKSRIDLTSVSFKKEGESALTAGSVSCIYNLSDLLSGVVSIEKLELENLDISLSEKRVSKVVKAEVKGVGALPIEPKKGTHSAALSFPKLDLNNITISDLSIRYETGKGELVELKDFSLMLDKLKQGERTNLSYAGQLKLDYGATMMLASDELEGSVTYVAGRDLLPDNLEFTTSLNKVNGSIQDRSIKGNNFVLKLLADRKGQAFLLRECSLNEVSGGKVNSKVNVAGKILRSPLSAKLDVEALPISTEMLNLFGTLAGGYSFGQSKLYYKGSVNYHENQSVEARGKLFMNNFAVVLPHQGQVDLPAMNLSLDYGAFVDLKKEEFVLSKLVLSGVHLQQKIINVNLADEARVMYGAAKSRFSDTSPTITTKINGLGLSFVNQFVPDDLPLAVNQGALQLNSILTIGQGGRVVNVQTLANAKKLSIEYDGLDLDQLDMNLDLSLSISDMKNFELQRAEVSLSRGRTPIVSFSGHSKCDLSSKSGLADLSLSLQNQPLLREVVSHFSGDAAVNGMLKSLSPSSLNAAANFAFDTANQTLKVNDAHISLNKSRRRVIGVDSQEPFSISLKDGDITSAPMGVKLSVDSFDLRTVNPFLPDEEAILAGELSANVIMAKGRTMDVLSNGHLDVNKLTFRAGNKRYGSLTIKEAFNLTFRDDSSLDIKSSKLDLAVNQIKSGSLMLSGRYNWVREAGDITVQVDGVSQNILSVDKEIKSVVPLKNFNLSGISKINLRQKPARTSITGKLIGRGLTFSNDSGFNTSARYNAGTSYNVECAADNVTLNNVKLQVQQGKTIILDSHASGKIATPVGTGRSALFVGTDKVDLEKVLAIFGSERKRSTVAVPATSKPSSKRVPSTSVAEPPPIDMDGLNLRLGLDLKHIDYYGMDNGVKGELVVRDNKVQARPLVVTLDGAPVTINSSIDLGAKQGYRYSLSADGKNVDLSNALAKVVGATKRKPSLVVSGLDLNIKGKGVTTPSLEKHLNSKLNVAFEKISLPHEPNRKGLSGTTFGFVHKILETAGSLVGMIPGHLASQVDALTAYLNGKKNLEFSKGDLNLNVENGKVNFDKIIFEGDDIDKFKLSGNIGLNRSVKVDAILDFGTLKMPLPISGTLDRPRFDTTLFLSRFVTAPIKKGKDIATDILKSPEKVLEIIEDKDKRDQIVDDILGDFLKRRKRKVKDEPKSVPSSPKEKPAEEKQLKQESAPKRHDPAQELIEDVLQNLF